MCTLIHRSHSACSSTPFIASISPGLTGSLFSGFVRPSRIRSTLLMSPPRMAASLFCDSSNVCRWCRLRVAAVSDSFLERRETSAPASWESCDVLVLRLNESPPAPDLNELPEVSIGLKLVMKLYRPALVVPPSRSATRDTIRGAKYDAPSTWSTSRPTITPKITRLLLYCAYQRWCACEPGFVLP